MRRVTIEALAEDPVGCYVAGEAYAHFCAAPTLWGILVWGRPDEHQAIALGRSLVAQLRANSPPYASIFDASRVESVDPSAFGAAGRYLLHNRDTLSTRLQRLALVRPNGIGGATVAGAFEVLPRPYPARVFAGAADAYAWLVAEGGAPDWPADGAGLIEELFLEVSAIPAMLAGLRALLDGNLEGIPVAKAAKQLGLSERTLQRRLGETGTSYQDELGDARIRAAKRLLLESDTPLTSIALEVGCASLQHFSALFRRREQESPSAFRKRHRRKDEER